jgi:hypothetical protein
LEELNTFPLEEAEEAVALEAASAEVASVFVQ